MEGKWKVVDFETTYRDNGCDVQADDWYKITNGTNSKWVDEYKFFRMRELGLIQENGNK